MGVVKVVVNGTTKIDITPTDATAEDVASGKVFFNRSGTQTTGTASGGGSVSRKDINFYDYDGTLLYSYTKTEFNNLSALPANPSHTGLTAQGWNWTKQQISAQLTAMPDQPVDVGQMYITQSGDTEIDVEFVDAARLSPNLAIAVNGTITVDWGDNTTPDEVTGTSLTTKINCAHSYSSTGNYTIEIHVVSGYFAFYGSSSIQILYKNTTGSENRVYTNCIKAIRIGNGITSIGNNAFYNCYSLASITIPSGITSIGNTIFSACYALASITIPSDVTSIGNSVVSSCSSLSSIMIPSGVTSIGTNILSSCSSIASIMIPSGVTSITDAEFQYCYSLTSITIPSGVTSIGNNAFYNCYSLASITIPSSVTSIGNNAFASCYGVAEYHIKPTTIPTLGTTVFANIPSDCVIYVPSAKLNDYKTATGWSDYARYMQGE